MAGNTWWKSIPDCIGTEYAIHAERPLYRRELQYEDSLHSVLESSGSKTGRPRLVGVRQLRRKYNDPPLGAESFEPRHLPAAGELYNQWHFLFTMLDRRQSPAAPPI